VFRCDTGTTYILDEFGVHSDCNAPDPNKMYEFKREIFYLKCFERTDSDLIVAKLFVLT